MISGLIPTKFRWLPSYSRGRMLLNLRMGSTTYIIGVHFSAESKDTLEDKMKRLMRDDVKADNF